MEGFAGSVYPWRELTFCRRAVETGEPAASFDVLNDPESSARDIEGAKLWNYRAELDVPLIARGRLVGIAACSSPPSRASSLRSSCCAAWRRWPHRR